MDTVIRGLDPWTTLKSIHFGQAWLQIYAHDSVGNNSVPLNVAASVVFTRRDGGPAPKGGDLFTGPSGHTFTGAEQEVSIQATFLSTDGSFSNNQQGARFTRMPAPAAAQFGVDGTITVVTGNLNTCDFVIGFIPKTFSLAGKTAVFQNNTFGEPFNPGGTAVGHTVDPNSSVTFGFHVDVKTGAVSLNP